MRLRSLLIVTGGVHIEGGAVERSASRRRGKALEIRTEKRVTGPRRAAVVLATTVARSLRRLTILWTPWGRLVDPARLLELRALVEDVSRRCAELNKSGGGCEVTCAIMWELLSGLRRSAVEGWLARRTKHELVREARVLLEEAA